MNLAFGNLPDFWNLIELDHSVHEVTSHDFLLSAEPFLDAGA